MMSTFTSNERIVLAIFLGGVLFICFSENKQLFNNKKFQRISPYLLFAFITIFNIWQNDKLHLDVLDLDNKKFVFWLSGCVFFTIYVLGQEQVLSDPDENDKLKEAVRKAFIALIIAFFAKIDLIVAPFFLVLVFSYFSDFDWV